MKNIYTLTSEKLPLNRTRRHGQNNRKSRNNQRKRHRRRQSHTAPTSRELAPDDPILALEVAVEAHNQNQNGDADEGGAERFADAAEAGRVLG